MPKIKYDVDDVEEFEGYAGPTPKRGIYEAVIRSADYRESSNGHNMFEIILGVDTKVKEHKQYNGCPLWQYYVIGDQTEEWMKRNLKAIVKVFGLKGKGEFDPEALAKKMVGKRVRVLVKNENSEEYGLQAKANGLLPLKAEETEEAGTESASDESEEVEEDEEEGEEEETTVEEDIADLTRTELKKYIKDNDLEVKVTAKMSDDDVRTAIVAAASAEDEEESEEEEGSEPPF